MSYREENGQVILTMTREDYELVCDELDYAVDREAGHRLARLMNRLNQGNPNYRPYRLTMTRTLMESRRTRP